MKKGWSLAAMAAGLILGVGAVIAAREARESERDASPIPHAPDRSWNLPTGVQPANGSSGTDPAAPVSARIKQTLGLLKQLNGALSGQTDPLAPKTATPPGGGLPEPLPYSIPQRIAYGFFALSPEQATAALEEIDPDGRRVPRNVTRMLIAKLSKPGESSSEVIRVNGRSDPGPGVGALLAGLGLPGLLPPLFGDPVYLDHAEVKDREAQLENALTAGGGAEAVGQRAALWRVKEQKPEAASQIGALPPPGEPLSPLQVEIARRAGSQREIQLIQSLVRALHTAAEREGLVLLLVKTVA